jgi:signal transduction histidine kinase
VALLAVVGHYRDCYPQATISVESPEHASVLAHDKEQLKTVIDNIVENAIEHNDCDSPHISLSLETNDETVTVRIGDDGPGIPPGERKTISQGVETQLQHGSSLGLWLIYWLTSAMGGTVDFEENEPRGAVVIITFQSPSSAEAGAQ